MLQFQTFFLNFLFQIVISDTGSTLQFPDGLYSIDHLVNMFLSFFRKAPKYSLEISLSRKSVLEICRKGHSDSAFVVEREEFLKKRTKSKMGRGIKPICTFAL